MSPRTADQFEEIRETSITKILDASLELFAEHGYESTSISQIATKAGVSKGLIYNYFDSKLDLLKAMFDKLGEQEAELMDEVVDEDPKRMTEKIIRVVFREYRERSELWKMMTSIALQVEKFEFVHRISVQKMQNYFSLFEKLLDQAGYPNPKGESKLLAALFDGIGFHYLILKEDYPLDEVENFLIKKYCKS